MNMLDKGFMKAMLWALKTKEEMETLQNSEEGISNVVAMIVMLAIVILLIGTFWDALQVWIAGIMETIFDFEL